MNFRAADGTPLRRHDWPATGTVRGQVYVLHGFGEHAARYGKLALHWASLGFSVLAIDHRGHGESGGERAFVTGPTMVADDFQEFVRATRDGDVPAFLFGHSMGGSAAVGVALAMQEDLAGLMLSGPYLEPHPPPPVIQVHALGILRTIAPRLPVQRVDSAVLSTIEAESAAYDRDPLVHHGPVVARTAWSLVTAGNEAIRRAGELTLPLVVFHGEDDTLAGVDGSRRLVAAAGSADKALHVLAGVRHEILNDTAGQQLLEESGEWLLLRTGEYG